MATWTVTGIVVAAVVALVAFAVIVVLARPERPRAGFRPERPRAGFRPERPRAGHRREPREAGAAPCSCLDEPKGTAPAGSGVSLDRRRLLQRGLLGGFVAALSGVVASGLAYIWPTATGSVGGRYQLGSPLDLRRRLLGVRKPYFDAEGSFYVVPYPQGALPAAESAYDSRALEGLRAGFVALSPACPHQGCHVPFCVSSQWFECPCHGSRFNAVGELQRGPSPRGLDRYAVSVEAGSLVVDTRRRVLGPAPGVNTTHQRPAGSHCT